MTMLEKIARALCAASGINPDAPGPHAQGERILPMWRVFLRHARVAIEAMRDGLTEDMAAEMECQFSTEAQWHAAIDAILAEPVESEAA